MLERGRGRGGEGAFDFEESEEEDFELEVASDLLLLVLLFFFFFLDFFVDGEAKFDGDDTPSSSRVFMHSIIFSSAHVTSSDARVFDIQLVFGFKRELLLRLLLLLLLACELLLKLLLRPRRGFSLSQYLFMLEVKLVSNYYIFW